jgi:rhodanese-related sulfurtransferase
MEHLKPLMAPQEFAPLQSKTATPEPQNLDPEHLSGAWRMEQVLQVFPSAQRALFQRYHIGGCSSCGYHPQETLETVAINHGLEVNEVVGFIQKSQKMEKDLEISPAEVADLLKKGAIKLLDVRTPHEYEIAKIRGSVLVDQALAQEIVQTWPKDSPIVTVCHHGIRSLDAATYLRGHRFTNARSMRGGIDAWALQVDPSAPRY